MTPSRQRQRSRVRAGAGVAFCALAVFAAPWVSTTANAVDHPLARAAVTTAKPSPGACPAGLSATTLTTPPAPRLATGGPKPAGALVTRSDGSRARTICLGPLPTPMAAPSAPADRVVGGPRLGDTGVVTDLPAGVPGPPDMPHVSYVLADLDTGAIIAAKNAHAQLLPASTLKTLLALVVMPALDPQTEVVGADEDTRAEGTRVGITVGGKYTVDNLLNGLILVSGNDAAYALARAYGGKSRLLADMNAKAASLGAWDTVAVDPSGLDADGQHSSSYDLALIGRAVMQLPDYRRRAALQRTTFPGGLVTPTPTIGRANGKPVAGAATLVEGPPFEIANHNPLLGIYPGLIGVKSGYTSLARNTYVGAVTHEGRTLLVAEMGSPEPQVHSTPALLDWGFAYAAQARPVGRLVAPGEVPTAPNSIATTAPSASLASQSQDQGPTAATQSPETSTSTPRPIEHLFTEAVRDWWASLPEWARWIIPAGTVLLIGLIGALANALLRRRRRSVSVRGRFQR